MISVILCLFAIFAGKEALEVLAMLWAIQIINGKKTFSQVPAKLKEQVREILVDSGCEYLIDE